MGSRHNFSAAIFLQLSASLNNAGREPMNRRPPEHRREIVMTHPIRLTSPFALALILCASAHAELYQWKDASGKTIFSDRPPVETQKAATVDSIESKKNGAATGATSKAEADDPRTALAREEAAKKKATEKNKKLVKWRCAELEKQYATLQEQYAAAQSSDVNKAATLKTEMENHRETIQKMCE